MAPSASVRHNLIGTVGSLQQVPQPCPRSHSKQFYRASGLAGGAAVSPTQLHLVRRREQCWLIFDAAETKTREPVGAPFLIVLTQYLEHTSQRANGRLLECGLRPYRPFNSDQVPPQPEPPLIPRLRCHVDCDRGSGTCSYDAKYSRHKKLATSEMHYNHAQSIEALRRLQSRVLQLSREGRVHRNSIDRKRDFR